MNKHIRKLHERNSHVAQIIQEGKPEIGVFWIHPKTRELVYPHGEPVEHGMHDPDLHLVDSNYLHRDLWERAKGYHPELAHLKYDDVPRGRVYQNSKTKKFHVLGSEEHVLDPKIQNKIRGEFKLPKPNTIFEPNEDYEMYKKG